MLAGDGTARSQDGQGTAARFKLPNGVAVDSAGNVYVADTGNATIRMITPDGVTTTLAGTVGVSGVVLGTKPRFGAPAKSRRARRFPRDQRRRRARGPSPRRPSDEIAI